MDAISQGKVEVYYREFLKLVQKYGNQCRVVWVISGPDNPIIESTEDNSFDLTITYNQEYLVEVLVNCYELRDHQSFRQTLSLSDLFAIYTPHTRPVEFMAISVYTPQNIVNHLTYRR